MEFTIGFFDHFGHLCARICVTANDELEAITTAAEECKVKLRRVGRIDIESPDRDTEERLAFQDAEDAARAPSWIQRTDE